MGTIVFILVLSILVIVHEWGHYITAKKLGVKVEKFSIGFGRRLYSWDWGGTEFMISAIPLGGFVKMAGDERSQCKGSSDEFFSHPIWHRALIVVMGPVVNFVFAYLCFAVIFMTGFPAFSPVVAKAQEGTPAFQAGLQKGDKILAIDGEPMEIWDEVQETVMDSGGRPLKFRIQRGTDEFVRSITPEGGSDKNLLGEAITVWRVGIELDQEYVKVMRYGVIESLGRAGTQLVNIVELTLKALFRVATGAMPARDAISGPIGIFNLFQKAAHLGIAYIMNIMGIISASLAIFNLFPIPVLDGGHLLILLMEKIYRKPLPAKLEENMMKAGFSFLICLMIFVFYNDMARLGWIDKIKVFVQGLFHNA